MPKYGADQLPRGDGIETAADSEELLLCPDSAIRSRLLTTTHKKIASIPFQAGFDSISRFNAAFRSNRFRTRERSGPAQHFVTGARGSLRTGAGERDAQNRLHTVSLQAFRRMVNRGTNPSSTPGVRATMLTDICCTRVAGTPAVP
jgi:hypothetical protein